MNLTPNRENFFSLTQTTEWSDDKIRLHLDRSAVPVGEHFTRLQVPNYVANIVVIEGYAENEETKELYVAPALVPQSCTVLISVSLLANAHSVSQYVYLRMKDNVPFRSIYGLL